MSAEEVQETKPLKTIAQVDNSAFLSKLDTYEKKHPLKDDWSFWFVMPGEDGKNEDWGTLIKNIHTFGTLEEFWGLQAALPTVENLTTEYMFFKKGIKPEWEDPKNDKGGKWVISLGHEELGLDVITKFWGRIMFSIIGNNFKNYENINGFYISFKKYFFKLQVWTNTTDPEVVGPIGEAMKELLVNSEFGMHEESQMRQNNEFNPTRFTNKNPQYSQLHNEEKAKTNKKGRGNSSIPVEQIKIVFNHHNRDNEYDEIVINLIDKVEKVDKVDKVENIEK